MTMMINDEKKTNLIIRNSDLRTSPFPPIILPSILPFIGGVWKRSGNCPWFHLSYDVERDV